jgi:hypothetical protein
MTAVPNVAAARAAALAGRLRGPAVRAGAAYAPDVALDGAELRSRLFAGFLTAAVPPPDWRTWTRTAALAEAGFHGPAQGEANERFYGLLRAYLSRTGPPAQTATAVQFLHALATWDFPRAATAADTLLAEALQGEGWLPDDLFRDGAVVAKLKVGDVRGARAVFDQMKPVLADRFPLRSSLLSAHVRRAEALEARDRATRITSLGGDASRSARR